jgi:aspartate-semialdehyde dehydrogenase
VQLFCNYMKVAVVGATGLVGTKMLEILDERQFPVTELLLVASERSVGKQVLWRNQSHRIISMDEALAAKPSIALFSAGGATSLEHAPRFAEIGCVVIDNSSAWRMDPSKKLVVPEVNGHVITKEDSIIANPNCSTIQMVLALKPLHDLYCIKRVVVSTYQSVTGTGKAAVDQLMNERAGKDGPMAYRYKIDLNLIPQIDVFMENGYTKEEMKMVHETCKIMGDDAIKVSPTCIRVPVMGGHSESCNIEFENTPDLPSIRAAWQRFPGLEVVDNPAAFEYPMPLVHAHNKDAVFVGRLRMDESNPKAINCWIVSDNLRKGAATNAVQIAELVARLL